MKKRIFLMVVASCLTIIMAGTASAAQTFEGSVDITPDNPTIKVGESVDLTASWSTNKDITWYAWEVAGISQGDVEMPEGNKLAGERTMVYSGVVPGEYEICFSVWHHSHIEPPSNLNAAQQEPWYADDCVTVTVIDPIPDRVCTWEGETAWADVLPYNEDGKGNWAAYSSYVDGVTGLYAGQTMEAGKVDFSKPVDGYVVITIQLNEGWQFKDSGENVKIQDYDSAPSGNPSPGQFDWKGDATGSSFEIEVPENSFYGVHVDVERCSTVPEA